MYAKDMAVVLVITPVLIVLSISGAFTDLGFVIGNSLTSFIGGSNFGLS